MSVAEIHRFNSDASQNPVVMLRQLDGSSTLEDVVHVANDLGYEFSMIDLQDHLLEQARSKLSDEEFAAISAAYAEGAWGGTSSAWTFSTTFVWVNAWAIAQILAAAEISVVSAVSAATVA